MKNEEKQPVSFFRMLGTAFIIYIIISLISGIFVSTAYVGTGFGNVAVIELVGPISTQGTSGSLFSEQILSSEDYVKLIDEAAARDSIDAIVLHIDSPGGSAVASYEIVQAIKKASEIKPVVAYIREVGASGAYWAASASDYIVIQELAITGSVGVIASYLEFSGLFEKYGIGYVQVTGGEYKDMGTPFRNLTEKEEELLQMKIDEIHSIFYDDVKELRNLNSLSVEAQEMVGSGIFFTAREALNYGLVDEINSFERIEPLLKERYNLTKVEYARQISAGTPNLFGMQLERLFGMVGYGIGESLRITADKQSNMIVTT